jgi:hypothetical protein
MITGKPGYPQYLQSAPIPPEKNQELSGKVYSEKVNSRYPSDNHSDRFTSK